MVNLCPNCFAERQDTDFCPFCHCRYNEFSDDNVSLHQMTVLNHRYIIGRTLGVGGFGVTYLSFDNKTGGKCAVKEFMPSELAVRDRNGNVYPSSEENTKVFEHCKAGFINEAKTLYTFRGDPTIVNVSDYFEENHTAYFTMEYLDGCNMRAQMQKCGGRIPVETATVMLVTVGSALMDVHKFNILHRDLSPENIFLTTNGSYKLIDFGAARFFTSRANKSLSVLLKPGFAPPEQYSSRGNQGPWTDVYGLAATYYYLVSGTKPLDAMDRLSGKSMVKLCDLCPGVPKKTSDAVSRALELDYHVRYKDMLSFLNDVDLSVLSRANTDSANTVITDKSTVIKYERKKNITKAMQTSKSKKNAADKGTVCLIGFEGTPRETKYKMKPDCRIKIGRGTSADIRINGDLNISRLHCSLIYNSEKNTVFIQDYSSNGTFFYSGQRLQRDRIYELKEPFYLSDPKNMFRLIIAQSGGDADG